MLGASRWLPRGFGYEHANSDTQSHKLRGRVHETVASTQKKKLLCGWNFVFVFVGSTSWYATSLPCIYLQNAVTILIPYISIMKRLIVAVGTSNTVERLREHGLTSRKANDDVRDLAGVHRPMLSILIFSLPRYPSCTRQLQARKM